MKSKVTNRLLYENKCYKLGHKIIAGTDEVGRGCWAGPVVAAMVVFPQSYKNTKIRDSKTLSAVQRQKLYEEILKNCSEWTISFVDAVVIDKINIKQASIKAMRDCFDKMKKKPDCILIDAEKVEFPKTTSCSIIKGDDKSMSIAAASIVAKVERYRYMQKIAKLYPQYHFDKHKGYGTLLHLNALRKFGPIDNLHRLTYKPIIQVKNKLIK